MEDYVLDIIVGKGPSANSIRLDLPKFTLIGATTRAGQLSAPLRDRFGVTLRLELYTPEELARIVTRSAGILDVDIVPEGAYEVARRSRGTPRIANRMLRRVRDFAQVKADGIITKSVADEAPPEIAGAIRYADRWKIGDVIITGRGGGSMEDLWAFNDERVARAIYHCETPVISAVGHEPDVTISDFVADARASTPSNAAEIAVPDQMDLRRRLQDVGERLAQSETARLDALRQRLDSLAKKRVLTDHLAYVEDRRMELLHVQQRLGDLSGAWVGRRREQFSALAAALDAMSPLKVLSRGYAIVQDKAGRLVKTYQDAAVGDQINITLGEGGFTCTVDKPWKEV